MQLLRRKNKEKQRKQPKEKRQKVKRRRIKRNQLLQAVEYQHFRTLRLVNIAILLFSLCGIVYIGTFLYNKIYTTIGQVQNIILIDAQIQGNIIDFEALDKTIDAWEEKFAGTTTTVERDPFSVVLPPQPPEPAPTSTPDVPPTE